LGAHAVLPVTEFLGAALVLFGLLGRAADALGHHAAGGGLGTADAAWLGRLGFGGFSLLDLFRCLLWVGIMRRCEGGPGTGKSNQRKRRREAKDHVGELSFQLEPVA
jgi:hypothetical protein